MACVSPLQLGWMVQARYGVGESFVVEMDVQSRYGVGESFVVGMDDSGYVWCG